MAKDALLLLEDDKALAIHPDGDGMVLFDPDTGEGAECCCESCPPASNCCPSASCWQNAVAAGGCFPTQNEGHTSCGKQHGPIDYAFSGTIQAALPTRQTFDVGGGLRFRVFAYQSFPVAISRTGVVIPRDAVHWPSQMTSTGTGTGFKEFSCVDYNFRIGSTPTGQGHNGAALMSTSYRFPFGTQAVLEDNLLATYTAGNDGANGDPNYTQTAQFRLAVCATFVNRWNHVPAYDLETNWPPKALFNRGTDPFEWGMAYGDPAVNDAAIFDAQGVWVVSLVPYHLHPQVKDGATVVLGGMSYAALDPIIGAGAGGMHNTAKLAAQQGVWETTNQYLAAVGGTGPTVWVGGSGVPAYSRAPSKHIDGYTNACGCITRLCGAFSSARKIRRSTLGSPVDLPVQCDAHTDYSVAFDVAWGSLSKCTPGASAAVGECGAAMTASRCSEFFAAFAAGDAIADINGDGLLDGSDYRAFVDANPACLALAPPHLVRAASEARASVRTARRGALGLDALLGL